MTLSLAARTRLAHLRVRYRASLPGKLTAIESAWAAAQRHPDSSARRAALHRRVHNLAGSAALHGLPALAERAHEVDRLIGSQGAHPGAIQGQTELSRAYAGLRGAFQEVLTKPKPS